ncbi:MAG: hypothetical protein JWR69_1734 [Pedosphaera sp.]|nr:hypothetical protein [Pedosphaera sp.]
MRENQFALGLVLWSNLGMPLSIKLRAVVVTLLLFGLGGILPRVQAEASYENPVIPGDHPDPSAIRVGTDYWATATSSEWGPEFPLLHSTDLVNWETVGSVFPHRPDWATGNFWAPEIAEYKGLYYVYYVGRQKGGPLAVAVATATQPSGPYTDRGPLVAQSAGSIDPVPVTDENGERYLVWKEDGNSRQLPTPIWAQRLNEDGTKLMGEPKELIRNDTPWEGNLVEGPFLLRNKGWFYLFYSGNGCCGTGCDYAVGVARSRSLLGPWEKNPANPILAGNEHWKCPGHGSIITDPQGRFWLLYHAYAVASSVFTGREAMLDEVKFGTNDWPTINDGKGPGAKSDSPFNRSQRKADLSFFDNFKEARLQPGWQWPQDNEPSVRLQNGHLGLSPKAARTNRRADAVLARSTTTSDYTATAIVEIDKSRSTCSVGLCAFGDSANSIGLAVGDGKLVLSRREKGKLLSLAQADAPLTSKLYLRLTTKAGYQFSFASSVDGEKWIPIGDDLAGKQLPPWDRSIRIALTVDGDEGAEGRFDSLTITPTKTERTDHGP